MPVSVTSPRGLSRIQAPLRALVLHVLRAEGRSAGEVGVVIAGDALLREVNRSWRGLDHATDVISFAYDEHERDAATRPVTGDLLVSLDRVAVQARRFRVSAGSELARLVVHGTLHLCGHDHMRAAERARMRAREAAVLRTARAHAAAFDRLLPAASARPARARRGPARPVRRAASRPVRRDAARRAR